MMTSQSAQFHPLLHSAHLIEERLRLRLGSLGVQPRQARVLDALSRMGEASQVELAQEFDLSAASMSTMTVRLLKAGLITRRVDDQELRKNLLTLTKQGRRLMRAVRREWRAIDTEIANAVGKNGAEELEHLTLRLRDALGGRTPGGVPR